MTRRLVFVLMAVLLASCSDSSKPGAPEPGAEPGPSPIQGCEQERQVIQIRQEFLTKSLKEQLELIPGDQKLVLSAALLFQYLEKKAFIKPSAQKYEDLNYFYFNIFKPNGMPLSGLPPNLCQ